MDEINRCITDLEYEVSRPTYLNKTTSDIWVRTARERLRTAIERYALEKEKASLLKIAQALGIR